jgi:Type II CAAX prenyl endopeptidase Rce1-like
MTPYPSSSDPGSRRAREIVMQPEPPSTGVASLESAPQAPEEPVEEAAPREPVESTPQEPKEQAAAAAAVPDRYLLREDERGRYLTCLDIPEAQVRIERGQTATAAAARRAPEGTIFVDGAAQGEPFLDLDRRVYNLDHHEGCVRSFTLASCEQALALALRGLDLREKPWTIHANEPDLDAVLAIWVLLNALHLREGAPEVRRAIIPLVRLEGVIDVHGLDLKELTGFAPEQLGEATGRLDGLRERELAVKREGRWESIDPLEYTASQLRAIDALVYPPAHFAGLRGFEELARVELGLDRIAVVCRSEGGIYEVERDLKRLYGRRLGVIALQKGPATYALRQVDHFLPVGLAALYDKLNVLDPAVTGGAGNRWGGSAEIGGSPRETGTGLSAAEIAEAFRLAFRPPGLVARLAAAGLALGLSAAPMAVAWAGTFLDWGGSGEDAISPGFAAAGLALAVALFVALARKRPRLFGLHRPEGLGWLALLPPALAGAFLGGGWLLGPAGGGSRGSGLLGLGASRLLLALALPLLAEVVFRGLAQGILMRRFRVQHPGGRWFVSRPVLLCALLYAAWTLPLWIVCGSPVARLSGAFASALSPLPIAAFLLGTALFGLAAGMARERAASLAAPVVFHYVALGLLVLLG